MKLVFASGNKNKVQEIGAKLAPKWDIISMRDLGFEGEIVEDGLTLEENARIKAEFIHKRFDVSCFADDSGLEIEALGGDPGVYSARYAGEGCTYEDNNLKVLKALANETNRSAVFRTVIHLILNDEHHAFEGRIEGEILKELKGEGGFGYDPIFRPHGFDRTFAEMTLQEKNQISHRAIAVNQLASFLLQA